MKKILNSTITYFLKAYNENNFFFKLGKIYNKNIIKEKGKLQNFDYGIKVEIQV